MKRVISAAAILILSIAAIGNAQLSYPIRVQASNIDRELAPAEVELPIQPTGFEGDLGAIYAVVEDKSGKAVPAQIERSGIKVIASFVLPKLKAGQTWDGLLKIDPGKQAKSSGDVFQFQIEPDKHEDLALGDQKVWRYMMAYDPDNLEETYKVFHHIHDFHGNGFVTKGAGGKYSHHRGLFVGWRKTTVEGADYDTWHMKPEGTVQKHAGFDDGMTLAGAVKARRTHLVHWLRPDGKPIFAERRTLTAWNQGEGRVLVDVHIELASKAGDIKLDGDPAHAGFQFRAAQEVADNEKLTKYVLPAGIERDKEDNFHGDWATAVFPIQGHTYSVVYLPHKTNRGRDTAITNARLYARFGEFFATEVKANEPMEMRYRVLVIDSDAQGAMTTKRCQSLYDGYHEPVKVEIVAAE